ncbi:hypothetical protein CC_0676 [Caulobacter vibrioides CB15]|uniref:Uncharacterized protein n=1 Tax=Caulobacter vibrioides (strain ATCC 19089 / CIP 103742 / CB 15) TaxID=190650 RepID=Q9AAC6_CAUVC|nr:hypothetical protein CC_0676 [Caulobacter vibrioides CB15]
MPALRPRPALRPPRRRRPRPRSGSAAGAAAVRVAAASATDALERQPAARVLVAQGPRLAGLEAQVAHPVGDDLTQGLDRLVAADGAGRHRARVHRQVHRRPLGLGPVGLADGEVVSHRRALAGDLDHHADDPALNDQIGVGALAEHPLDVALPEGVRKGLADQPERRLADQAQHQPDRQAQDHHRRAGQPAAMV